jgi:hypothetical protein
MVYNIQHNRKGYKPQTTLGEILLPTSAGKPFCFTLEDTVRGAGIKVNKVTAIPETNGKPYKVDIRYSNSFKRDVLVLYDYINNVKGVKEYVIERNGVKFTYVLAHGGNTHIHSDGCILVAKNTITNKDEFEIQGTREAELFKIVSTWIKNGDTVYWNITNQPQKG